jgi:hypothetical protein
VGLFFLTNLPIHAQSVTKVGTTAARFLLIDASLRASAMGSAFVSVANDASAMYWNPAGITKVQNFDATFINSNWIADLSYNYAGAVLGLGDFGALGVNATFLTMGQIVCICRRVIIWHHWCDLF